MPVLPFHRYIGPGNPIDNGEPVDEDDRIAKAHDIKYENARTVEDVREADVEAIYKFRKNWREGNWHSFIGDVGLSIKYFVESYTGVIYPTISQIESERNCKIIHIKNILKLHCVFKNKPFLEKYESNVLVPSENLDYSTYDFVSQKKIDSSKFSQFVYVPIEWNNLFLKYRGLPLIWNNCVFCDHNFCDDNYAKMSNKRNIHLKANKTKIKCDIFNFDFWLNIAFIKRLKTENCDQHRKHKEELHELDLFEAEY
uniref:Parvo_coat_N domain-containing protein n=1 Tax=Rhodnius prolixus TaxID=13249 RepID=T1HRN5_RHOPR